MAAVNPPLPVPLTVIKNMTACGLSLAYATIFATQIFHGRFYNLQRYLEQRFNGALKTFSILTIAQGQIRLFPASKQKIKAFTQWNKNQFRLRINPTTLVFTVDKTAQLLYCSKNHNIIVARSAVIA